MVLKKINKLLLVLLLAMAFMLINQAPALASFNVTQLTNNGYNDNYPQVSGGNVVWRGAAVGVDNYDIFFFNGATTTRLTNNTYIDDRPQVSGNNVVWQGVRGPDDEIFFFNGSTITQLTNNSYNDTFPQISGGNVVWQGFDGNDSEIFLGTEEVDNMPPTTAFSTIPATPDGQNNWYTTNPTITLTPDEPATTYYQWDGTDPLSWQTYTAPFNALEGEHTLYYYSEDLAGNVEATKSGVIKTDTGLPTVNLNAPLVSTLQSASTTFNLSWSGSDAVSGMDTYTLQVKQNQNGSWSTILSNTTLTSYQYTGTAGNTYYFRLSGKDMAGNAKTVTKQTVVPYDCVSVTYTGSWTLYNVSGEYLNTLHRTTAAGDTALLTFTGNRVALIAEKSSQGSNIEIRIDGGAPINKSLYSSTLKKRQVIYASPTLSYASHTIQVKNLATAGRPEANVDAIAVLK